MEKQTVKTNLAMLSALLILAGIAQADVTSHERKKGTTDDWQLVNGYLFSQAQRPAFAEIARAEGLSDVEVADLVGNLNVYKEAVQAAGRQRYDEVCTNGSGARDVEAFIKVSDRAVKNEERAIGNAQKSFFSSISDAEKAYIINNLESIDFSSTRGDVTPDLRRGDVTPAELVQKNCARVGR